VALDAQGRSLGTRTCTNTPEGWANGLAWARSWEGRVWGIENSGSLGKSFAQSLLVQGEGAVHEVSPHRTAQYRRRGRTQDKADTETDALVIARLLLAEGDTLPDPTHADLVDIVRKKIERTYFLGKAGAERSIGVEVALPYRVTDWVREQPLCYSRSRSINKCSSSALSAYSSKRCNTISATSTTRVATNRSVSDKGT